MTSSETSQSTQETVGQSFFMNIVQRIRNLRGGQRDRASTTSESSFSSRCSSTEDVKQGIDGRISHGEYRIKNEVMEDREQHGQRCGEKCRYYQMYQETNQLYQEAKTEGERQYQRAEKNERAWRLSEDSGKQLQEEQQKNRNLSVIVREREQEIVVLQQRVQDLHEDLDEEVARRQSYMAGPEMTEEPILTGPDVECRLGGDRSGISGATGSSANENLKTGEMSQMMAAMLNFFQDERKHERDQRERDRNYEKPSKVRKDMKIELNTSLLTEGSYKGLKHLNDWIKEVELLASSDRTRVQMIKLAAQPSVLDLIGIEKEEELKNLTWEDLKKLLVDTIPELDPWKAARHLMEKPMTANDNILAFAANLKEKYKEVCRATKQEELPPGYNQILAAAVLGNMDFKAKWTYRNSILTDPAGTIKQMAYFFNQSEDYKRSLFENASKSVGQEGAVTGGKRTDTTQYEKSNYVVPDMTPAPVQPTYPMMSMSTHAGGMYATEETTHVVHVNTATPVTSTPYMERHQVEVPDVRQNGFLTGSHHIEGNGSRSPISERRRICFRQWQDWRCATCRTRNPATWFTCNKQNCDGRATDQQLPEESWQCELTCGQTNWLGDQYCNSCLKPNPHINADQLRPRNNDLRPRPRHQQRWFSRPPILEP